jgi:hypothetical protein
MAWSLPAEDCMMHDDAEIKHISLRGAAATAAAAAAAAAAATATSEGILNCPAGDECLLLFSFVDTLS